MPGTFYPDRSKLGQQQSMLPLGIGWMITGGLVWFLNEEYSFFSVVFPLTTPWLGRSLGAAALLFICQGLFPRRI